MNEDARIVPPARRRASLFVPTIEMRRYYRDAAAAAARELGIFEVLANPPGKLPLESLARTIGAGPRRLRALVDLLCFHGVLRRNGDAIAAGAIPDATGPIADAGWGRLAEVIRRDRPLDDDGIEGRAGEGLRRFHDALFESGEEAARDVSDRLGADGFRSSETLLDIGAGAGIYAAAWLRVRPDARATLVDREAVLALARGRLAEYGSRIDFVVGDALHLDLPPAFDVALLANFLHLHSPEECRTAVRRAAAALRSGGTLVIKDLRVEADRSGPEEALIFAVHMALFSKGGSVYSVEEISEWLAAAGLEQIGAITLPSEAESILVSGRKP